MWKIKKNRGRCLGVVKSVVFNGVRRSYKNKMKNKFLFEIVWKRERNL